jgi:DNA-binding SARP family transcriptional activator
MLTVSARLLGPPAIVLGETVHQPEPNRVTAALYYFAYRGDRVARAELLTRVWPEADEGRARASLRQLIAALRASPLAAGLEVERKHLRWPVPTDLATPLDRVDAPWTAAGALLEAWLDVDPLDEAVPARYLELAASCTGAEHAMARFLDFERRLERELGLTPSERVLAAVCRLRDRARPSSGPSGAADEDRASE